VTNSNVLAELGSWINNGGLSDCCAHGYSVLMVAATGLWVGFIIALACLAPAGLGHGKTIRRG
jgi:hypothetical protein